jgi:hypothetical protein
MQLIATVIVDTVLFVTVHLTQLKQACKCFDQLKRSVCLNQHALSASKQVHQVPRSGVRAAKGKTSGF